MIIAFSTRPRASSIAILIALTIASVWALLLPVRGSDETILIVPLNWPWLPTTSPPDGFATGDASGEAPGDGDAGTATGGGAGTVEAGEAATGGGIGVGALAAGEGALAAGCAGGADTPGVGVGGRGGLAPRSQAVSSSVSARSAATGARRQRRGTHRVESHHSRSLVMLRP